MPEPIPPENKLKSMMEFNKDLLNSDAILVLNHAKSEKKNHIGVNTIMEIGMAFNRNKKIFLLNRPPESCKHELDAINCKMLNGTLDKLF